MSSEAKTFYRTCDSLFNACETVLDKHIYMKRRVVQGSQTREPDDLSLWAQAPGCANAFINSCPELPVVAQTSTTVSNEVSMDSDVEIIDAPQVTINTSDI